MFWLYLTINYIIICIQITDWGARGRFFPGWKRALDFVEVLFDVEYPRGCLLETEQLGMGQSTGSVLKHRMGDPRFLCQLRPGLGSIVETFHCLASQRASWRGVTPEIFTLPRNTRLSCFLCPYISLRSRGVQSHTPSYPQIDHDVVIIA